MDGHAHFGRKYRLSVEVSIKALNLLVISVIEIFTILYEEIENIISVPSIYYKISYICMFGV